MSNNNSQTSYTALESIIEKDRDESDINQMLSGELLTTSQPLVQLNTSNMIHVPTQVIRPVQQPNNLTPQQQARRRRRQRQRERRRQRREEQRRLQPNEGQPTSSQRQRERIARQHQYSRPRTERSWSSFEERQQRDYWPSLDFPDSMDEEFNKELFEAYLRDKMNPQERWEQEQLNELEGFAALEHLIMLQDDNEQETQIHAVQQLLQEEEEEQNQEQLIQTIQWESMAFQAQQLNEN